MSLLPDCGVGRQRSPKVVVLHKAVERSDRVSFELMSCCDVLLVTPASLMRSVRLDGVRLDNLCALIVDEAQETIARNAADVSDLVDLLQERRIDFQFLLFAEVWRQEFEDFVRKCK